MVRVKLQPGLDSIQEHYDVLSKLFRPLLFTAKEGIKVPTEYECLRYRQVAGDISA